MAKKKTKRKLARPKLPMQRHLNLRHEGRYFDLRQIFDRVNERHFRGRLRLQNSLGPSPKTTSAGIFHFWHDPGRRPCYSDSSAARPTIRAALVSRIHPLPRDAALSRAG